jgi:hypothetical protein
VHQAQTAKTPPAAAALGQIRDEDGPRPSDQNHFHRPVAADEQSNLTSGFKGEVSQIA